MNIGYCGDDCNQCPRYLATQSGDDEQLKKVLTLWRIVGWRITDEPPEKLVCHGCASLDICELGMRDCAIAKGLDSCGKCADCPCDKMNDIFKNNQREAVICQEYFSKEDYELFQRAFFDKKKRLDEIHKNF